MKALRRHKLQEPFENIKAILLSGEVMGESSQQVLCGIGSKIDV